MVKGLCSAAGVCMWFTLQKKQLELGDRLGLSSYLLKPVQRMTKYALLLQQMMKEYHQQDSSDQEHADLMVGYTYTTQPHNRSSELTGHKGGQWG